METKSSTKITMVALVLVLATAMLLAGYYYGKASVVCPHYSTLCGEKETEQDEATEEEVESGEEVDSESIRDVDLGELVVSLGYEPEMNQVVAKKEYYDLTSDGKEEVVFSVDSGGTAGDIAIFVYGYQNGELKQLLKEDGYVKYGFEIRNNNRLRIVAVDSNSDLNKDKPNSDMMQDVEKTYVWSNNQFIEI